MVLDTMFDDWDSGKLEVPGEGSSCGELINLNAIMPFSNKAIHMDGMKYRDAVIEVEIREWILFFSVLLIVLSPITTLLILFSTIFYHSI